MEIVDPKLEGEFNSLESERMIRVALVCTNATPSLRPLMSEAEKMLEGEMEIDVSRFLVLVYIFFIIFFSIICSFSFVFQVYR